MPHKKTKAILGAVSFALTASTFSAPPALAEKEKCLGAALKGKNSCAANGHSCAGQATTDCDAHEWILVEAGTCGTAQKACQDKKSS